MKRYMYAMVYINQFSSLGFLYLQKQVQKRLVRKTAFEHYCTQHRVKVQHYHADNGIFCAHKWVLDCRAKAEGIDIHRCAYYQNIKMEEQEMECTMLIHAKHKVLSKPLAICIASGK